MDQNNSKKNLAKTATNDLFNGLFRLTHYSSYHVYRRSVKWLADYLMLAFLIGILGCLPFFPDKSNLLTSVSIMMLMGYFLIYYWVISKGKGLKKDSKAVLMQISTNGMASGAWNIYDGIYETRNEQSVELSFFRERSYLANWITLARRKGPQVFDNYDLEALQNYLVGLQNISNDEYAIVAYATLDNRMKSYLVNHGIEINHLSRHYLTKPSRWDYAANTGKFTNALWNYPKFGAYLLTPDLEYIKKQHSNQQRQKQSRKEQQRNLINLTKYTHNAHEPNPRKN